MTKKNSSFLLWQFPPLFHCQKQGDACLPLGRWQSLFISLVLVLAFSFLFAPPALARDFQVKDTSGNTLFIIKGDVANVGIGTAGPASKLSVNGGISVGSYYATAAPSNGMIISGNVGIGKTNPGASLDVNGAAKVLSFTLPTGAGEGKVLASEADGTGYWKSLSEVSGVTGSGADNRVTIWTGTSTVSKDDSLVWDRTNHRLSIGTDSPSTYKLNVQGGDVNLSQNAEVGWQLTVGTKIVNNDGSAAAPAYSFNADNDSGLYRLGANKIGLITAGSATNGITIDSAGKVGIGTTGPAYILQVGYGANTTNLFQTSGLYSTVTFSGVHTPGPIWNFTNTGTGPGTRFYVQDANNNTDRLTFDFRGNGGNNLILAGTSSGNVGIGTTGPGSKLSVNGGASIGSSYTATVAPTDGMIIQGNVGIGMTSPGYKLDVYTPNTTDGYVRFQRQDTTKPVGLVLANGTNNQWYNYLPTGSNDLRWYANGQDRMTLTQAGDLTITGNFTAVTGTITGGNLDMGGNNIIGVSKLTVGTIDPVYEIDGEKYASYVADYVGGVRTETSGTIQVKKEKSKGKNADQNSKVYEYVIDFNDLEKKSDLWLFWETSNKEIDDLVVILTPGFEGKTWYEKEGNKLIIYADESGEVSYRLTAPRLDDKDWSNLVVSEN